MFYFSKRPYQVIAPDEITFATKQYGYFLISPQKHMLFVLSEVLIMITTSSWRNKKYNFLATPLIWSYTRHSNCHKKENLTFSTHCTISADDKLIIFLLFFPVNKIWQFMSVYICSFVITSPHTLH